MKNPTEPHQYNKMPKSGGNSVCYVVQLTNDTTSIVQDEPFAWVVLNNGVRIFLKLYLAHPKNKEIENYKFLEQIEFFSKKSNKCDS